MAHKLVIVESPAKARTISRYLGKDYEVEACGGHVRDLPEDEFGVDVDNGFEPTYEVLPARGRTVGKLKKSSKQAELVYLAPDPDREGEAIAWHLTHALDLPEGKVRRATFHEITREAVREAFESPRGLDMDLVNAQQARRILDRIVGYELSPLISKKIVRGLSAGRVQSVALRFVVEREREIEAFEPEEYWEIIAWLTREGEKEAFEAKLLQLDGEDLSISSEQVAEQAVKRLRAESYRVHSVRRRKRRSRPFAPLITSTLQQSASSRLRLSTAQTMRLAQQLYEGVEIEGQSEGLITYMRTDSTRVSERALRAVREHVREAYGAAYLPSRPNTFKSPVGAQAAHEAIRPTDVSRTPESVRSYLPDRLWRLYDLIWRSFVASQMNPAVYDVTEAQIETESGLFLAVGRRMVFDGYTRVMPPDKKREADQLLPQLAEGEALRLRELVPSQHFTQPPPRYTEASLVRELEKRGIGRPSTYAPTISTLLRRNYVRRRRRALVPTDLGSVVTEKLVGHFPRELDYRFTRDMEEKLDRIEAGEADWRETLREFYGDFSRDMTRARENMTAVAEDGLEQEQRCPKCGRNMVARFSRQGDKFLGCSGFPECDHTISLNRAEAEQTEHKCPECGAPMVKRTSRRSTPYLSCSRYPQCRRVMGLDREGNPVEMKPRSTTGLKCQKCGGRVNVQQHNGERRLVCSRCSEMQPLATLEDALRQTELAGVAEGEACEECGGPMAVRRSKRGFFLGCSRYPECKGTRPLSSDRLPDAMPTQECCEKCGRPMVLRWGKFGRFLACSGFPQCRNTWQLPGSLKECPRDGCDGHLVPKISPQGKEMYGCTRFPQCDHVADRAPGGKKGK